MVLKRDYSPNRALEEFLYTILRNTEDFSNWKKRKRKERSQLLCAKQSTNLSQRQRTFMATLQSLLLSFQRCSLFRRLIWSEHTRNCTARRLDFHRFEHEGKKNGPRVELGGGLAGRLSCSKHAINLWLIKLLSSVQNDGERVSLIAKKSNIFVCPRISLCS